MPVTKTKKVTDGGVVDGIWTPWAHVVCRPCHGQTFHERRASDEEHARLCAPIPEDKLPEGEAATSCDKCGRRCSVSEKVAREHELSLVLKKALACRAVTVGMEQTGGMCSAVGVHLTDGRYLFITEADDGAYSNAESFIVGAYENEDDGCDEGVAVGADGKANNDWTALTRDQTVEAVTQAVERMLATPKRTRS